jgi:two-component system, OmpR family, phosphate regulon sensor histidine kinase PhoR
MAVQYSEILDLFDVPTMLVANGRVAFCNVSAQKLFGNHIAGQDVRLALRNPAALALIANGVGGRITVEGLSVSSSIWEIACHILANNSRLVTFDDLSVQASVARAHADFVANASHELRTPLAAIVGYAETLMEPNAGGNGETRDRFLSIIRREAQRMQALVDDLMSLSRIEASKHEAPQTPVDMVALARETAGEVPENASVAVETHVASAIVAGDRGQLAQVLRNLVDNGLKYGKPGGLVTIQIDVTQMGWVCLAIKDEGEGIAAEHLPRLTERFYRADASRSRQAGGTGLGLSIVKHIIERHRGRFDIFSKSGQGTTASIMLQLVQN